MCQPALLVVLLLFGFGVYGIKAASAATYYTCDTDTACNVQSSGWATGSDVNACTTKGAPCKTIGGGIGKMASGDTLIVGDGVYHEDNIGRYAPSGTVGSYTTIQTENDFGVEIIPRTGVAYNTTLYIYTQSYIVVRGFVARGNDDTGPLAVVSSNHIKIIRNGLTYAATDGNPANADIGPDSDYVLLEENYAFGGGRYQFVVYWSDHVVARRNVARNDYFTGITTGLQSAAFVNYDSVRTVWQNNIAIDSDTNSCCTGHNGLYAAFFNENKTDHADDTSQEFDGNIVLNFKPVYAANFDDKVSGTRVLSDNIYWDSLGGYQGDQGPGVAASFDIRNMTIGANAGTYSGPNGTAGMGTGASIYSSVTNSVISSIFAENNSYGVADYVSGDYNALYGNGANYGGYHTPSAGAHDLTSHNILYNGSTNPTGSLKYLPRGPESGSVLATAGSGGGRVGAEVLWKIGIDGTLWGETGWNTVRNAANGFGGVSDRLWPFPNEDVIKSDMAAYSGPGPSGARGFCAVGKQLNGTDDITLTSYIWEYLGNQMPVDLYSSGGTDTTAPTVTNVTSDTVNGSYNAGDIIDIDVTFSEAVTSTGSVTVTLETGTTDRTCTFTVSNSTTGTCNYTVQAGDTSSDLTVNSIAGTVADAAANPMTTPATPTTNLAANKALVIDTTAPTNQNTVFASSTTKTGGAAVAIVSSADATNSVWFAPSGTSTFSAGSTMTTAGGTATSILAPATAGSYKLFVIDAAGNVSSASTATLTVDQSIDYCTYYVRSDGSNSNAGTGNTSGGAWLTLQHAADTVVAGDTVCVADGTYAGFYQETSGASGNPITYRALGSAANITSRNSRTTDNINIESWTATPADYITIDGFNVYNATRMGIRAIDGVGIVIQNCTIYGSGDSGILTGNTPGIQILNNTAYSNGDTGFEHNIYVSNASSDNCVISGNTTYSAGGGNGIQVNGDWQEGGDGYIDNCVIEDNLVYNNTGKGFSIISVRYSTIRNNITYGNHGAGGIHVVDQLGSHPSINNVVVNNTLDEANTACIRVNEVGVVGNIVFNNACIGSTGIVFETSGNYQSNNLTLSSADFLNYAGHDYHLVSGSAARDSGLSTYQGAAAPTADFEGGARPLNGSYDVGAYEYSSGVDTTAPGAPSGLTVN